MLSQTQHKLCLSSIAPSHSAGDHRVGQTINQFIDGLATPLSASLGNGERKIFGVLALAGKMIVVALTEHPRQTPQQYLVSLAEHVLALMGPRPSTCPAGCDAVRARAAVASRAA
jgi:hypothetical protein